MKLLFIQLLILLALNCCLARRGGGGGGGGGGRCSKKALCAQVRDLNEEVEALKIKVEELTPPPVRRSCKDLYDDGQRNDGVYELESGPAYCHLSDIEGCGSGGFTLVMKIDGSRNTFEFDSPLWSNDETYNTHGRYGGLDDEETKQATYSRSSFDKVCLGMKAGGHTSFISIDIAADSLHTLIADGQYHATSLGRDAWKSLLSDGSLQQHCNREGFNAVAAHFKARIGILSNEQNDCGSDDSYIGFGTNGSPRCGNRAYHGADNGDKETAVIGYILVQ